MFTVLSFIGSEEEVVSGFPKTVSIESNDSSALIYYTFDSSIPTMGSNIYTGPIEMPSDRGIATLSAIAFSFDGYVYQPSTILSHVYQIDQTELARYKFLFFSGINVVYPGGLDIPFLYGPTGTVRVWLDEYPENLEFIVSDRDVFGNYRIGEINQQIAGPELTPSMLDNLIQPAVSYPTEIDFNPYASVIVSDSRVGAQPNLVEVINGPHMSLRDPRRNLNGLDFYSPRGTNSPSGSMAAALVGRKNKVFVAYHMDTISCRWVKSINDIADPPLDAAPASSPSGHLVFAWNIFGRHNRNIY